MAFKLKLAGASVAVALAVAVGTAAGNWLSRPSSSTHLRTDPPYLCNERGGTWSSPPSSGPLSNQPGHCSIPETHSPAP